MIGVEFTRDGQPDTTTAKAIVKMALESGLMLLTCGTYDNVIRWIPPLVVTEAEIDEALTIFAAALDTVTGRLTSEDHHGDTETRRLGILRVLRDSVAPLPHSHTPIRHSPPLPRTLLPRLDRHGIIASPLANGCYQPGSPAAGGETMMVRVNIDSVRVSLMSQHRVVVLKDVDATRYLPIWIGPFEADAITIELQDVEVARPLTHDLLKAAIEKLGAEVERVAITELRNDTFYAEISLSVNGKQMEIDARPSDAIALAVRAEVPVYVDEEVMMQAAITPEPDLDTGATGGAAEESGAPSAPDAFHDFLEELDLSGLE